ncbi:MAG: S8 family serine peptidase [Candidatus Omnitrophica bacterium]|nr:S8 family serine peptidase [Candidatus Omnitrophota bacterium]
MIRVCGSYRVRKLEGKPTRFPKEEVIKMKGEIMNKLLLGLGMLVAGLFLAVIFKSFLSPPESPPLIKEEFKPQAKEEIVIGQRKEEIIYPESKMLLSEPKKEKVLVRKPEIVEYLKNSGIEVKDIAPLEGLNTLVKKNPEIAQENPAEEKELFAEREEAGEIKEGDSFFIAGEILLKETLPDGKVEFSKLEVEQGKEEEAIKLLEELKGIEADYNDMIPVVLLGDKNEPTPTPEPSPTPTPEPLPTGIPTPPPATAPNDPEFSKQWALPLLQVPEAWEVLSIFSADRFTHSAGIAGTPSVKIAIIDTGAKLDHPDLEQHIDANLDRDFVNNDNEAEDESSNSHGTHVAGIIGALLNNQTGIAGVVPNPQLVIVKALKEERGQTDAATLAEAISYAVESQAKIILFPWGTHKNLLKNKILRSALKSAFKSEAFLIAAAGNHKTPVLYPAKYKRVFCVGGSNKSDVFWVTQTPDNTGSSNPLDPDYNPWYGENYETARGKQVDILAPAGDYESADDIYSTIKDGYGYLAGTSMSSAFVTGVAGLALSVAPYLNKYELRNLIISTADKVVSGDDLPAPYLRRRANAYKLVSSLIPEEDEIWITGLVKDQNTEKPLANISVTARSSALKNNKEVKTDAYGRYKIVLSASDFKYEDDYYEVEVSVSDNLDYEPQKIEVVLGEVYVVDFVPEEAEEDEIIIKGRVRDNQGKPLSGLTVRAKCNDFEEELTGQTDSQGWYRIEISEDDFAEEREAYTIEISVDGKSEYKRTIKAVWGKVYVVSFGKAGGQGGSGTATVYGTVTDAQTGKPIANARVVASRRRFYPWFFHPKVQIEKDNLVEESLPGTILAEARTDAQGKYEMTISLPPENRQGKPEPLASGPYTIYLSASAEDQGYGRNEAQEVSLSPGDKKEVDFSLTKYPFPPIGLPNPRP